MSFELYFKRKLKQISIVIKFCLNSRVMSNTGLKVSPFVGQYSRQSFDRFGDDLCQLLLSYLSFEDKIRLQCVAKQWNRLIFNNKHKVLVIDSSDGKGVDELRQQLLRGTNGCDQYWHHNRLKSLLKKCPNIKKMVFDLFFFCFGRRLSIGRNDRQHVLDVYENSINTFGIF